MSNKLHKSWEIHASKYREAGKKNEIGSICVDLERYIVHWIKAKYRTEYSIILFMENRQDTHFTLSLSNISGKIPETCFMALSKPLISHLLLVFLVGFQHSLLSLDSTLTQYNLLPAEPSFSLTWHFCNHRDKFEYWINLAVCFLKICPQVAQTVV